MSSTVIAKNVQIGADGTASNNFTIFQPATPDGTLRIGNGNTGITSSAVALTSAGNVGIGTSSPNGKLDVRGGSGASGVQAYFSPDAGYAAPAAANAAFSGGTRQVFWNDTVTPQKLSVGMDGNATMWFANLGAQGGGASASGGFNWYTSQSAGGAPTVSMRIDSSGNVGIGTSSPQQKFHVYNAGSVYTQVQSVNASTGAGAIYKNATANWLIGAGPASGGSEFAFVDQTNGSGNPGERMRIDSSGNLLVGGTTNSPSARILGQVANGGNCLAITNTSGTAQYNAAAFYNNGTTFTNTGAISVSGTSTSYNTSSDYRLKDTIAPMTGALAKVALLKPCKYKWKVDGSDGEGFIAHELAEVVPACVTGEKDAVDADGNPQYQGIDTSFLVATLTAAIQEQQAIITALTARVTALEGTQP